MPSPNNKLWNCRELQHSKDLQQLVLQQQQALLLRDAEISDASEEIARLEAALRSIKAHLDLATSSSPEDMARSATDMEHN